MQTEKQKTELCLDVNNFGCTNRVELSCRPEDKSS